MENIGKRIREIRVQKGMTQDQLAAALNTTKAAISRYETGNRRPSYEQLSEISRALGVSVLALLEDYVEVKNELGETNVYLRDLNGQAENMLRTGGLPLKGELLDKDSHRARALAKLVRGESEEQDTVEPLLNAFNKLDFWGQQFAIELVEMLTSNPCFLKKDLQDNEHK